MQILHVVGARPNFMKVAPVLRALRAYPEVTQRLVHTGQHYDAAMSEVFFSQLELPAPDVNLGVGSGSHAVQTAQVMLRFEETVLAMHPDLVLVYGDVNSTVAASLVCAKLGIRVGHVEAGLRSFDRTMPEEINRLVTDQIADLLFTPSADGDRNLLREGVDPAKIHLVGNVMIDTLVRLLPQAEAGWPALRARLGLGTRYGLVTLHRPSNVDEPVMLAQILATLGELASELPLLFPIHPRTRRRIAEQGLAAQAARLHLCEPLGYLEFLALQAHAQLVISDSGGVQEETTYLRVPCLTVRANTERPVTVDVGSNQLVGQDMARLRAGAEAVLRGAHRMGAIPPLWDGRAGERIAAVLV
ncbi:non-hydrolyzing UDP-N-acetylglucosamine 2-epimerase [Candidatus Viridilinea mediisalina]|uniref:UDP-N-acetylglucosamine 2-epimerase (Non-hydrolyzing) n=1 Tax=Candidatus Viridilinea mediisalina TaxID=2024553 RepID=A0A2A6RGF9_9CHLR|nr:UDP-N-acetylglucosamine 2-epimerase (non-hydrolyzing) [Candidatus Viridilinea mediisalina]PDW02021.1 UDP-N-acetylglucosamine 2-epimerase (non-hydrolyzing) [Candidatus Viridilinea mediisalina]